MPHRPLATLIFPPLVESNFGTIYPSLPVLAGFLESNGIGVHQLDLNEEFAEFLLSREILSALAAGTLPGTSESSAQPLHMAAARWSLRYPDTFIDVNGCHRFGATVSARKIRSPTYQSCSLSHSRSTRISMTSRISGYAAR